MSNIFYEREIPVVDSADVVVAGGGLAGVAAALAAARAGASVILIETNGFLGGVATAGMCCSVFNCLFSRERKLLVEGIPLEIVDALAVNAGGPGMSWRAHKGHIIYDVERAKLLLVDLLEREGVTIRLNATISDVVREGKKVSAVVISDKTGLSAVACRILVDATGDCDAAALAGVDVRPTGGHRASYVFRLGNVDVDRFVDYFREHPEEYPAQMDLEWTLEEALRQYDENGTFLFPHGGGMQMSLIAEAIKKGELTEQFGCYDSINAMQMHLIRKLGVCHIITGYVSNKEMDSQSISRSINEGKRVAYMVADCFKKYVPGFENAYINASADDLGIRGSRCIYGEGTFLKEMRESAYRCEDAIGVGVIQRDEKIHKADNAWKAQVFGDDVYEIPLSCMIPKDTENIIIGSGRGVDSNPPLIIRVMVTTMTIGQGAGVAAAVAAKSGSTIKNVDYQSVRAELERQGVRFPSK